MASSGRGHRDGVEITSIGVLYQGPLEKKYWSSSRGKEKYPYPIGYKATRWHGGHCYFMEVLEGLRGPSFVVKCEEGITCSGQTPSVAWEDILKKKHAGAKRVIIRNACTSIDGAEMFGFTNPLVQRLCRDLVVSASGAAENSNSLPDSEVKDCKEDAAKGTPREAGSLPESSGKSPVKVRRGKKLIQSPKIKGEGAEEKQKNVKHRVASQLMEEDQETKETKKQKLKRPARESSETSQDVKVMERMQINTPRKDNTMAQHIHPEEEEMPRCKRSKLPKAKVGPYSEEDADHVDGSQNVSSANSKRLKSVSSGTRRIKDEDRPERQMSKDSGHVTSPHGLSEERQNQTPIPFMKDTQESSAANCSSEVPMSHFAASGPSQTTSASDRSTAHEASQRNPSSRKKRMKLAKPQKIPPVVKPERYDTEVDLTQSEGFLSIDLMCPSAEDMEKEILGVSAIQKFGDVSSKQDGYLMLLAACKVAEVEQKNVTKEKTGVADVKRKRPISDLDYPKAEKAAPEVVCFPSSSMALRSRARPVVVVNELASSCSDMHPGDESSQILAPPVERVDTYSAPEKVYSSDIKVSVQKMPQEDDLLTGGQSKEDVVNHNDPRKIDVGGGEGEKVLFRSNCEGQMEKYSDKRFGMKEDESSSSQMKSEEVPVLNMLLHEQVSKILEGTMSGVQQKDATQEDGGFKVSVAKRERESSSPIENGEDVTSQSSKLSTELTNSSAACTVVSSDARPLKENASEGASNILNNIDPRQVDPLGAIPTAHKGTSSRQTLESVEGVVETIDSKQSKVCSVEMNVPGTTCDIQRVHRSACLSVTDIAVADEDLASLELQGSRSLITDAAKEQENSVPDTTTTVSDFGSGGTNQPVLSIQTVEVSATAMKIGCSETASEESRSAVVEANGIETGPDNSQGLDQHSASTVLTNNHHFGMDMPVDSDSRRNLSSPSEREECLPKSLKQPLELLSASVKAAPTVCFDAGLTKLEKESKNSGDENDIVNGVSPENLVNLQRDFVAEDLLASTSRSGNAHAIDLGAQSKALLTRTSETDMESSPALVDRVEFDLRVSADRSTPNITEKLLPAVVGAVRGTESDLEIRLENCNEICANTVFNLDQSIDLAAGTPSRKEAQVQPVDVDSCKRAIDHLEIKRESSLSGNLDVEMVSSATPVDRMESEIKGSSGRSEEDKMEDHVTTTVERVKDCESGARFQYEEVSGNGFPTVPTSKEFVGVPRDIIPEEQAFDSKGCIEVADRIKKHIDIIKSPVNQTAEAKMVSSDSLSDELDMDLANRGAESVMERFTPALIMAVKDTVKSAELALTKTNEHDTLRVRSSTDLSSQKNQGSQVLDLEGGVNIAESPVLVRDQSGCAPSDWRGPSETQEPGAVGEGKLPVQGASNPALSPEYLEGEKTSSSQLLHTLNSHVSELEEIRLPGFISPSEVSTGCVTTLVTEHSLDDGALEKKHIQTDGCTGSDQDIAMMEAVSPVPRQMQNSELSENLSQRSESDSAGRELTSSMMTLLLPQALPFLPSSKKVEKKEKPVMCEDIPSKTGDVDVGASVGLVGSGSHPSELPAEADISPTTLDAGRARSGDSLSFKASTTVGIVQQLRSVNDHVLNREEVDTDCGSSVQASDSGCPMEIDLEVNAGNQVSSSDSNQEQRVSSEVCHSQEERAGEICLGLGGRKPSELHAKTTYAVTTAEIGNKSKDHNKEFACSETLPAFAGDDCEISQHVLLSGAICLDVCEDNPKALILDGTGDGADEHVSSCFCSHITSLNPSDTQDSVEVPGLMTSSDTSSLEGAPQVQQEAKVCIKFVPLDLDDKNACSKTEMKIESADQQLAGCNESDTTASARLDNQKSDPVVSSQSDLGVGLKMSTDIKVEDKVPLVEHPEPQMLTRSNCQIQDFEKKESVYLEEIQRSCDLVSADTAPTPNMLSSKPESTSSGSQDAQSKLLRSGDNTDHSQGTTWQPAAANLSDKVNQPDPESTTCPEPSLSSVQRVESGEIQPSYFQKMELRISIEHPTTVSTMVINVRGNEIRLCVCCGTGSERTLSVFRILYTEGSNLEHQLLTVLETTYKNRYYEEGKIKLVSDESGLRFTPDGQQLILLDSFEVHDSSTTGTRDGHGLTVISLECKSSTRLESDGALLCLAVREPQRLIAAGEDGVVNFWDMDPSWRSFGKKISLPKATLDGVSFTAVTSLSVVPHFQHMVVGCNPSGFFALWDMDRGTLLYSCQMFDDLLLKTSLVDTKNMNWEQPVFSEDTPQKTTCRETLQPLSTLPLICLLTMVTSKERLILESKENVFSFNEQEPPANEECLTTPEVNPRDTNAVLLKSHDGSSEIHDSAPHDDAVGTTNLKDLEHKEHNSRDKVELTVTDSSNSDRREQTKIPRLWGCKTVLIQGDRIVCGHALSDRPTSITSLGRYGVMGTADGMVHLWDVQNGRKLLQLDDLKGSAVVSLATSSSLAVLATAGENKRVNVYLQKEIFAEDIKKIS